MKKLLFAIPIAALIWLLSSPLSSYAYEIIGSAVLTDNGTSYITELYCDITYGTEARLLSDHAVYILGYNTYYPVYYIINNPNPTFINLTPYDSNIAYINGLANTQTLTYNNQSITLYNTEDDFINVLPPELRPTLSDAIWDNFYDLFELIFGYRPADDSIWGILRGLARGDHTEETDIIFPTLTPTPSPTPAPTPIPVQTIFVPDGNGNTTIIYQYPDPTSGVITQSPYNPNDIYNLQVNCNCDGNDNTPLGTYNPQDPYTYDASLFWADGFGVQMSDNPLTVTDDQQTMLKGEADQYVESAAVVANSFNVLPVKWIGLVGLLGGILIIAGLIRTFLGG